MTWISRNVSTFLCCAAIMLADGCFYVGQETTRDIVKSPSRDWSSRDCITIIASANENNYLDLRTNIKASATLYSPAVIAAINRNAQRLYHFGEDEYRHKTEELAKGALGMYVDWEKEKLVDGQGNYFVDVSQLDSIYFLVTLDNKAWPCDPIHIITDKGIVSMFDMKVGCYVPDISHVEDQFVLVNDKGDKLRPCNFWGRRNSLLTVEETMFVVFKVRTDGNSFLAGSKSIQLLVEGFESTIPLTFSVEQLHQFAIN